MNLKEYIVHHVKAKDAYHKTLIKYEEKGDCIFFEFKTGVVPYFVDNNLEKVNLEELKKHKKKFVICLNTNNNIEYLIANWKNYAKEEGLIIMFANPEINEKWLINTFMHARVTEEQDIEAGLRSLFSSIPSVV